MGLNQEFLQDNLSTQQSKVNRLSEELNSLQRAAEQRYADYEASEDENDLEAYEKAARDRDDKEADLDRAERHLETLSQQYNQAAGDYLNMNTQIKRLLIHIKENILYYMKAIWSYEPTDQRYFRLFNTEVPNLDEKIELKRKLKPVPLPEEGLVAYSLGIMPFFNSPTPTKAYEYTSAASPTDSLTEESLEYETLTLEQVADLDNLLGFKGNYMMFPLKKNNKLTKQMMTDYVGKEGLHDPDTLGEWSVEDFAKYVCCLKEQKQEIPTEELEQLQMIYKELLADPSKHGEEIIVPTGSLFIEALPGTHPILEDFKLAHRAIDVKKVQAETREMELENIRLAARLLNGELDDPDVDKKILVEGNSSVNINE